MSAELDPVEQFIAGTSDLEKVMGLKLIDDETRAKHRNFALNMPNPALRQRRISARLMDEYMDKLDRSDATTKPFIELEIQFKVAGYLIEDGYRDYEIEMGEEFSTDFGKPFEWIVRVKSPLPDAILKRRRFIRRFYPYKFLTRNWYKIFPFMPNGMKFWTWKRIAPIRWTA